MTDLFQGKRNALLGLFGGTLLACVAIWYYVIQWEQRKVAELEETTLQIQKKIEVARRNGQLDDEMERELEEQEEKLLSYEMRMAHGDVYLWIINRLQAYRRSYGIEFSEFDPPQVGDLDIFPKVPYKAARFAVGGTATYFGFGEFLAEFENNFPHMRVRRLEMEPAATSNGTNDEARISFKLEFTMLVKTNSQIGGAKLAPRD
jgi:hypothetical protein